MSNDFLQRLQNGTLTKIEQYQAMRLELAPSAVRKTPQDGIGTEWQNWELAPVWSPDDQAPAEADSQVIGGAEAEQLGKAINLLDRRSR